MSSSILFVFIILTITSPQSSSILLPLSHSLSNSKTNTTTHNLIKISTARSAARFHHHRRRRRVSLPLSPGADYTLTLTLNEQKISLYMDTGSDVVWLPCHPFECILCEGKYSPTSIPHAKPINITANKSVKCKSPICSSVHSNLPSSDLCAIAKCPLENIEINECESYNCPPFYYAYGDGSFIANLYKDTLVIPKSKPELKMTEFAFGCANTALGEPIGVAGFGRGELSLLNQLARAEPGIGKYFSYCLISHGFEPDRVRRPSPLVLGRFEEKRKREFEKDVAIAVAAAVVYSYTPMLENPKHGYFYCVGLLAVSIGRKKIEAPESLRRVDDRGNGGMVVDSGTTFTMLPKNFYESVVGELDKRVGSIHRRAGRVEERTGLSPCYYGDINRKLLKGVPELMLHFSGNSTVALPKRNYFYEFFDAGDKRKVGCVMLMDGGDEADSGGGPAGLLGNYQQQGFEVVYDLEKKRVGFAKRKCADLWDSLS